MNIFIIILIIIILIIFICLTNIKENFINDNLEYEKKIWIFWDKEELPPLINKIKEYNNRKLNDWKIYYLNSKTIKQFIPEEDIPKELPNLKVQHQSDWIRLYLLSKYGGVWMDASVIINDPKTLEKVFNDSSTSKCHFTGFSFKNENYNRTSKGVPYYLENWFIMAPKNSIIIKLWFEEFDRAVKIGFTEYNKFLKRNDVNINSLKDDEIYFTQHACLQYVLQKKLVHNLPKMIIMPAENDMLKLDKKCNMCGKCIKKLFEEEEHTIREIPYIKLTTPNRKGLEDLNFDYFNK